MALSSMHGHKMRVWDLPTRLFHWSTVLLLILLAFSGHDWLGLTKAPDPVISSEKLLACHKFFGLLLLSSVLFRIIWGFVGSDTSRFVNFVKSPFKVLAYAQNLMAGKEWNGVGHNPMGSYMMLALMAMILVSAITGLFTSNPVNFDYALISASDETVKVSSFIHHNVFYYVTLVLAALHICTALFYKFVKKDDIITPMITGVEEEKPGMVEPAFVSPVVALVIFAVCLLVVFYGVDLLSN